LRLEPVEQERVIELLAGAAEFARPLLKRLDLVDRNRPRLGEQTSDQGRLAVVDRAAGDEAQQIARLARARDLDGNGRGVLRRRLSFEARASRSHLNGVPTALLRRGVPLTTAALEGGIHQK